MLEIAFPVLNEELRLEAGVVKTCEFLRDHKLNIGIVVADNGSTDRTYEIAGELATRFPNVRLIHLKKKGLGLAIKEAWKTSNAEIVGYMDVDLSTDLQHLVQVLQRFENPDVDMVVGSRLMPGALVVDRKLVRGMASKIMNFLMKLVLRARFSDAACGFKFIRRANFEKLLKQYPDMTDDWFFNCELMLKAQWSDLKIAEVPVIWKDDKRGSKVKVASLGTRYLVEILRMWREKP